MLKEKQIYGATFSEIGQHSPIADIRKGIRVLKDLGADTIVSVGGGSPIDASKLILHFLKEGGGGPTLTHVAIPTTLGAAEYTVSNVERLLALVDAEQCVRPPQVTKMRMATRQDLRVTIFRPQPLF